MTAPTKKSGGTSPNTNAVEEKKKKWYVLRDLRRPNVKDRAYHILKRIGIEVFTPTKKVSVSLRSSKITAERPIIADLLIVHSSVSELKKYVTQDNKLQYRYIPGGWQRKMVVSDDEMKRFMQAVSAASDVDYYSPEDFSPSRIGEPITIRGGAFDGEEGILLSVNGKKKKSIVVRLANLFVAVIELKNQEEGQ